MHKQHRQLKVEMREAMTIAIMTIMTMTIMTTMEEAMTIMTMTIMTTMEEAMIMEEAETMMEQTEAMIMEQTENHQENKQMKDSLENRHRPTPNLVEDKIGFLMTVVNSRRLRERSSAAGYQRNWNR
jgi:hypothetical protein